MSTQTVAKTTSITRPQAYAILRQTAAKNVSGGIGTVNSTQGCSLQMALITVSKADSVDLINRNGMLVLIAHRMNFGPSSFWVRPDSV